MSATFRDRKLLLILFRGRLAATSESALVAAAGAGGRGTYFTINEAAIQTREGKRKAGEEKEDHT